MSKRAPILPKQDPAASSAEKYRDEAKSATRKHLLWIGGVVLAVALVAALGLFLAQPQVGQGLGAPGERMPIQSRDHIAVGAPHPPYNSDPPTSGWHYDTPLAAGFYETPAPDEQVIHNLEHGHIVISYDCSKLSDCEATKAQLRQLVAKFNNWKVVAVPRHNRDAAIALTAWGVIEKLDQYDQARIETFINAYRDRGPEQTAD